MNYTKWLNDNAGALKDKNILITGSTGALGTETVVALASVGANLIFVDRNKTKSDLLKERIQSEYKDISVLNYIADMQDLESVKRVCDELKNINIDVVILNAGTYKAKPEKIGEYNDVFQINFISPYIFAKNMLQQNPKTKIVVVGSLAHKFTKFNTQDVDCQEMGSFKIYGNAKRCLMFAIKKLCDNVGAEYSLVHPGVSLTNLMLGFPKFVYFLIKYPMRLVFMKPKRACLSIIKGAGDNTVGKFWIGPKFFGVWGKPKKSKLKMNDSEIDFIYSMAEDVYNK